jgi:glycosyltransferase involved in cell wall biosynthesis
MSRASVFALPSIEEGLSLVMAEALACGCPVIASGNTGARNLFSDGVEGAIVPVGDVEALAQNLVRLHDDRTLLEDMSRNAVDRVRSIGGWDSFGSTVVSWFAELALKAGHDVVVPNLLPSTRQTAPQAVGYPLPS